MMSKNIRVLHVVTVMNLGGIENFLMTLYRSIDRNRIQFDFLVHRADQGFFDDEILSLGGRIYRLPPVSPFGLFDYYKRLKRIVDQNNYSIVHSHLNANSAVVLGLLKLCNVRNRIAHSHIDKAGGNKAFLKKILRRYVSKVSTENLACSIRAGKWLYGDDEFIVFKNSIDTKKFRYSLSNRQKIRKELNVIDDELLIGNIARFDIQKNHNFILDIFSELHFINKRCKLLLIGDGVLKETIMHKVNCLNLCDHVIMTGTISNANEYLSAMDVFLFPSLYEGLGIVVIESQANGLPVLMSDTVPQEAIVTNLVSQESLSVSAEDWAKKIIKIKRKDSNKVSYDDKLVRYGYDVKDNAKKIMELYFELDKR